MQIKGNRLNVVFHSVKEGRARLGGADGQPAALATRPFLSCARVRLPDIIAFKSSGEQAAIRLYPPENVFHNRCHDCLRAVRSPVHCPADAGGLGQLPALRSHGHRVRSDRVEVEECSGRPAGRTSKSVPAGLVHPLLSSADAATAGAAWATDSMPPLQHHLCRAGCIDRRGDSATRDGRSVTSAGSRRCLGRGCPRASRRAASAASPRAPAQTRPAGNTSRPDRSC